MSNARAKEARVKRMAWMCVAGSSLLFVATFHLDHAGAQPPAEVAAPAVVAMDHGAFLSSLGAPAPLPSTPQGDFCPVGLCNRPLDCFYQGWNSICDPASTGEAAWCWGYPYVSNCEGECGCK